jgi:heme/copper-type cytochrome/quinol oxidase subunit 2
MDNRYYFLMTLLVFWLLFYFLVAYNLNDKKSTFHKYAYYTILNGIFIMLCFALLTTNIQLEKQIKKLEIKTITK